VAVEIDLELVVETALHHGVLRSESRAQAKYRRRAKRFPCVGQKSISTPGLDLGHINGKSSEGARQKAEKWPNSWMTVFSS
jgi:hypothetical protein